MPFLTVEHAFFGTFDPVEESVGDFGGQYAPESLVDCLDEIETVLLELLKSI
jgi:tryptophan synthase beta subunit